MSTWSTQVIIFNNHGSLVAEPLLVEVQPTSFSGSEGDLWRPCEPQEQGLVEAYDRRGGTAAATYIPLCSRPPEELRRNFTDYKGRRINLFQDMYLLSRTRQALEAMDHAIRDEDSYSVRDVVEGLHCSLPAMTDDAYYLVTYTDASHYAPKKYPSESLRDGWLRPSYIRRHFAVRVTTHHGGLFIPLSYSQFVAGCDMMNLSQKPSRVPLTKEEFHRLAIESPSGGSGHYHNSATAAAFGKEGTGFAMGHATAVVQGTLASWWCAWSGVRDRHYIALGRLIIKGTLLCLTLGTLYISRKVPQKVASLPSVRMAGDIGGTSTVSPRVLLLQVVPNFLNSFLGLSS